MLDIKFLRENPEVVKQNIRNKFQDQKLELVDKVIELDKENRDIKQEVEALRAKRNKISKQIGALMGQGKREEAEEVKKQVAVDGSRIEALSAREKEVEEDELPNEYTIKDDDKTTVETVDGEEISIDKFDETFIKPDIEDTSIDFDFNLIEEKLKEAIENLVNDYKNNDQIITDEVKEAVTEKETEITNKQEEMEKAKDEVEKKKAEEEAKRKAEEEAKKGFKVGNHRLKYGTYKSDVYIMDSSMYGTITLNQDGTFHIKANCEGDYPYKTMDCDGTYKATRAIDSYEYYDAIEFTAEEGDRFVFSVSSDNEFSDQWHGYSYQG